MIDSNVALPEAAAYLRVGVKTLQRGSGRPPQTGAHINRGSDVFSGDTGRLDAARDALGGEGADCPSPCVKRGAKTGFEERTARAEDFCAARAWRTSRFARYHKDAAHKPTTDLTRRFETIVIEALNVSGMAANHSLKGGEWSIEPVPVDSDLFVLRLTDRPPKGVTNWMSNGGFAANAAHNISVIPMPRSI